MNSLAFMAIAFVSWSGAIPLHAASVTPNAPSPFLTDPVTDEVLGASTAKAFVPFSVTTRRMAEQDARTAFDDAAQGSRIAIDNWWAQTGAALIVNNIRM